MTTRELEKISCDIWGKMSDEEPLSSSRKKRFSPFQACEIWQSLGITLKVPFATKIWQTGLKLHMDFRPYVIKFEVQNIMMGEGKQTPQSA